MESCKVKRERERERKRGREREKSFVILNYSLKNENNLVQ
jgi:hypothetical protein